MREFGLIGYPLTHSFSKKYFTEKFEKLGLEDCRYDNYSIGSVFEVATIINDHPFLEGLNVTIPYKAAVLELLSERSAVVEKTGACNCIKISGGKLSGHNTDTIGFHKTLLPHLRKHHRKALILGTGGAASAVEYVLQDLGIDYQFVSRNPAAGQLSYQEIDREVLDRNTVIINTTPVGMYPRTEEAPPIDYQGIDERHLLYDLVYNPPRTVFLQKGEEKGATIINGYAMLLIQAEESWNIWNR